MVVWGGVVEGVDHVVGGGYGAGVGPVPAVGGGAGGVGRVGCGQRGGGAVVGPSAANNTIWLIL